MINTYAACKVLRKYDVDAKYINRNTFAIGEKEITVKDTMAMTDTSRWRFNSYKSFFYALKDERLFYLTKEQMADILSYYYILVANPAKKEKERRENENIFRPTN